MRIVILAALAATFALAQADPSLAQSGSGAYSNFDRDLGPDLRAKRPTGGGAARVTAVKSSKSNTSDRMGGGGGGKGSAGKQTISGQAAGGILTKKKN